MVTDPLTSDHSVVEVKLEVRMNITKPKTVSFIDRIS